VTSTLAEHVRPEEHDPTVLSVVVSTIRSGDPAALTSEVAVAVRVTVWPTLGAVDEAAREREKAAVLIWAGAETAVTLVPLAVPISAMSVWMVVPLRVTAAEQVVPVAHEPTTLPVPTSTMSNAEPIEPTSTSDVAVKVPLKWTTKPARPSAVQLVADVHETLSSSLLDSPLSGSGVATIVHFVPLKCSARLSKFRPEKKNPTASQSVVEVQVTEPRLDPLETGETLPSDREARRGSDRARPVLQRGPHKAPHSSYSRDTRRDGGRQYVKGRTRLTRIGRPRGSRPNHPERFEANFGLVRITPSDDTSAARALERP